MDDGLREKFEPLKEEYIFGDVDKETGYFAACPKENVKHKYWVRVALAEEEGVAKKVMEELKAANKAKDWVMAPKLRRRRENVLLMFYEAGEVEGGTLSGALRNAVKIPKEAAANLTLKLIELCDGLIASQSVNTFMLLSARHIFLTSSDLAVTSLRLSSENFSTNPTTPAQTVYGEATAMESLGRILRSIYASMDEIVELGTLIQKMLTLCSYNCFKNSAWVKICRSGEDDLLTAQVNDLKQIEREQETEFAELYSKCREGSTSVPLASIPLSTAVTYPTKDNELGFKFATIDHLGSYGSTTSRRLTVTLPQGCQVYEVCRRGKVASAKVADFHVTSPVAAYTIPATTVVAVVTATQVLFHDYATNETHNTAADISTPTTVYFCGKAVLVVMGDELSVFVYESKEKIHGNRHRIDNLVKNGTPMSIGMYNDTVVVGFWCPKEKEVSCRVFHSGGGKLVLLEGEKGCYKGKVTSLGTVTMMLVSDTMGMAVVSDGKRWEVVGLGSRVNITSGHSMFSMPSVVTGMTVSPDFVSVTTTTTTSVTKTWYITGLTAPNPTWTSTDPHQPMGLSIPAPPPIPPNVLDISPKSVIFADAAVTPSSGTLLKIPKVPVLSMALPVISEGKKCVFAPLHRSLAHFTYTFPPRYFKGAKVEGQATTITFYSQNTRKTYSLRFETVAEGSAEAAGIAGFVEETKKLAEEGKDEELLPDENEFHFPPPAAGSWW